MPVNSLPTTHAEHDPFLMAAFAADDLGGAELERARRLVATCPTCAELVADLRTIAHATAALLPRARRRDFRLTPADAARLRPAGWRRLLAALAAPRLAFTRPLAAALTTLGLAGLLLASLPAPFLGGGSATLSAVGNAAPPAAPAPSAAAAAAPSGSDTFRGAGPVSAPTAAPSAGLELAPNAASPAASAAPAASALQATNPKSSEAATAAGASTPSASGVADATSHARAETSEPAPESSAQPVSPGVLLSGAILLVGLVLFGLRWSAVRLTER